MEVRQLYYKDENGVEHPYYPLVHGEFIFDTSGQSIILKLNNKQDKLTLEQLDNLNSSTPSIKDVVRIDEDMFAVIDKDGNIAMKYDSNGLDAVLLSEHLLFLIKQTLADELTNYVKFESIS